MTSETDLLKALQRFEKSITVDAIGIRPNFIMEVIAQNIKIGYYLNSIATSLSWSGVPKVTFNMRIPMFLLMIFILYPKGKRCTAFYVNI